MTVPRVNISQDDEAQAISVSWPLEHYHLLSIMSYFLWQVGSGDVQPSHIKVWEDWLGKNPDNWSV